jgi:hypothetical protein
MICSGFLKIPGVLSQVFGGDGRLHGEPFRV